MIHRITVNTHGRNGNVIHLGTRVHYVGRRGCAGGVKEMPRDNRCMYMVHVCCSYWVCGNVGCVLAVVKDSVLALEC